MCALTQRGWWCRGRSCTRSPCPRLTTHWLSVGLPAIGMIHPEAGFRYLPLSLSFPFQLLVTISMPAVCRGPMGSTTPHRSVSFAKETKLERASVSPVPKRHIMTTAVLSGICQGRGLLSGVPFPWQSLLSLQGASGRDQSQRYGSETLLPCGTQGPWSISMVAGRPCCGKRADVGSLPAQGGKQAGLFKAVGCGGAAPNQLHWGKLERAVKLGVLWPSNTSLSGTEENCFFAPLGRGMWGVDGRRRGR